ncbi:peroxisome proliferator-activated receptor gamma coactivator-related protein 1 isoform X2 [Scophthalmus maximus]|uniref:peroxisome proliferator-activated receptor gamma coactivator-related protein 1 isoform X2 n=1 Tax=Scophthalmus maximus TaxID=52904 RepID=UPI001FA8FC38|nr:peroxisome proliferator-activated receptor gamma coactivator-related protein 1 isoform X2 [Scophthalmus maximus]
MWPCGKMAARWRGDDADLNAERSDFLVGSTRNESALSRGDVEGLEMDSQSCTDHSILSIFDDATVASEGKSGMEEESESLLSALTEMLDSVEDDDGTLSPFDVLPDTKLLTRAGCRDNSVVISLTGRPTPRPKSSNVTFAIKRDGEKEDENKIERNVLPQLLMQQGQIVFHPKSKKAENEVDVFTSTSLVNLVRLMHPYCMKLHVEEGSKERKKHTLFSQEEVWKYERPTEESDEEINVVSDDEEPATETKEKEEVGEKRDDGKPLKSVLLNGNSPRAPPSRGKKRVSFGPVQVASFNESEEKRFKEKNPTSGHTSEPVPVQLNGTKALGNPVGSALEPQTTTSSEIHCDKSDVLPPKGETKAKSLSLQEYRQLRQKRQPQVEKQRNNTSKWPSVSEPPKELPPILYLQEQRQNSCRPNTVLHYPDHLHKPEYKTSSDRVSLPLRPSEAKPPTCSGLKRRRPESKTISPASPLPDATTNPNTKVSESMKSPAKKPTLLSSDPPNPVLVPLPVSQTASPPTAHSSSESTVEFPSVDSDLQSTTHLHKIQTQSSAACLQRPPSSSGPKPQVLLVNQEGTALLQEMNHMVTEVVSDVASRIPAPSPATTQTKPASECRKLQPQQSGKQSQVKETELEPKTPQAPSADTVGQIMFPPSTPHSAQPASAVDVPTPKKEAVLPESVPSDSGIEAPDLTSLLEQFEETQAKEERLCENETNPVVVTPPSNLHGCMKLERNQPVGSEKTSRSLPTPSVEAHEPLSISESPRKPLRNLPHFQTSGRVDIPEPVCTEIIISTRPEQPSRRKTPPAKAIQIIDPRPLPPRKTHTSTSEPPATHTSPHMYSSISSDHDYCGSVDHLLTSATQRSGATPSSLKDDSKSTNELKKTTLDSVTVTEWKTQTSTGRTEQPTPTSETNPSTDGALQFSDCGAATGEGGSAPCTLPTPPPSPPDRGRQRSRYRRRSPHSDSSSSSCRSSSSSSSSSSSASRSPKRRRLHHRRSESSSCSSSPCRSLSRSPPRRYRLSYSTSRCSRSRSRSWSRSRSPSRSPSRSRSPSPRISRKQWKDVYSRESRRLRREHEMRIQKLKAIDERRVVYVGRICRSMTHDDLRERFTQFGDVECVSLHFRDRGDHYGFVTFYNTDDAFAAIDNGGKIRKPDELPFDICFGGRRQFCNSNYADLDANRDADPSPAKGRYENLDFDSLLQQAQRGMKR